MRPLMIDNEYSKKITDLKTFAELNPLTMDDLLDMYNKAKPVAGDTEGYYLYIPMGYKVVFTIEKQVKGDVRHMSMSVKDAKMLPNPFAVEQMLKLLGFKNELINCIIDLEPVGDGHQAINVLELIKDGD